MCFDVHKVGSMKNYVLLYSSCFQALKLACYPFILRLSCSLSCRLVLYDYGMVP